MKKVLVMLVAGAFISTSMISCKKCGYCAYGGSQGNSSAVCSNTTLGALGVDGYKEAQTNCSAQGGVWVKK